MSMLTEKRNELVNKLNNLTEARATEIEMKVAEYRKSLESSFDNEAIVKLTSVIAAIDEVIAYEDSANISVQPAQTVNTYTTRPGMTDIITPSRL